MHTSPRIIPRSEHNISRSNIDKGVLDILYSLNRSGYEAYLVGGGLRDMLLGLEPKDFDVVTDATPEQVRSVFRSRCRIIGRRFRLAHVHVGDKVIEVATFRARAEESGDRVVDAQGMVRRDNVFGTRDEDVWRRDFTVNALYYDIRDFSLIDYVGAVEDLYAGRLRLIGDPTARYREDPVRMIRAVRFACKLGLALPPETADPLPELSYLLGDAAPARLYEEVLKLFHGGQAACVFERLQQHGLLESIFEQTDLSLREANAISPMFIPAALKQTDDRIAEGKSLNPAFLFAVMLWEPLLERLEFDLEGRTNMDTLIKEAGKVLNEQNERTSIPRPVMQMVKEIWAFQLPLRFRQDKAQAMLAHPRFRAAYDFLCLRAVASPELQKAADWWTQAQVAYVPVDMPKHTPDAVAVDDSQESTPDERPRRRRRRRS